MKDLLEKLLEQTEEKPLDKGMFKPASEEELEQRLKGMPIHVLQDAAYEFLLRIKNEDMISLFETFAQGNLTIHTVEDALKGYLSDRIDHMMPWQLFNLIRSCRKYERST